MGKGKMIKYNSGKVIQLRNSILCLLRNTMESKTMLRYF